MFWRDLFSSVVFLTFGLTGFAAIFGNIEADSERLAAKKHWLNVFRQELGLVIYVIIVLIGLYFFWRNLGGVKQPTRRYIGFSLTRSFLF